MQQSSKSTSSSEKQPGKGRPNGSSRTAVNSQRDNPQWAPPRVCQCPIPSARLCQAPVSLVPFPELGSAHTWPPDAGRPTTLAFKAESSSYIINLRYVHHHQDASTLRSPVSSIATSPNRLMIQPYCSSKPTWTSTIALFH
ncbi:hypothetical protein TYRP_018893 [Tyrophagus putrescentiae]|nr:hypothetical protein TYRP_018893 [Tyrophagus putrescentiae]